MPWAAPLLLAACATPALSRPPQDPVVPQAAVDEAIDRGVRWLLRAQGPDGSWPTGRPGRTALALYALLKSGVDPQSEAVRRGLAYLSLNDSVETYDVAILAQVLETLDEPDYLEWLDVMAGRLVSWQLETGDWSYPNGDGDLSNTQYAALGLWSAGKGGIEVPLGTWEALLEGVQLYASRRGEFGYRRGSGDVRPAMTAAGVGTLHICKWGLQQAAALAPKADKQIEQVGERGIEALGKHVDDVLSTRRDEWPFYKLYAIERVGALAAVTRLGGRDWYQVGAAELIAVQGEDGSWGTIRSAGDRRRFDPLQGDPWRDVRTAFALLFLRRATSFTGTGDAPERRVFGTDSAEAEVQVRATGADPLTLWITGWGPSARERFEWPHQKGDGPHVGRVEYLVDGEVAAVVDGDPSRPAGVERFAVQHRFERSGTFVLQVRASVHAAPLAGSREPGPAFVLTSPTFEVEVSGIVPSWTREAIADRHRNLMPAARASLLASSILQERGFTHGPANAVDNFYLTSWLASAEDEHPTLTIHLGQPQTADVILLSSPRVVPYEEGHFARPLEVEVVLNEEQTHRVSMPPDERRRARLVLAEPVLVHRLDLTVRWKAPGRVDSTGLGEVELLLR